MTVDEARKIVADFDENQMSQHQLWCMMNNAYPQ